MSYGGQTNLAYVDDEAARKRAAKDVEASGQFYEQLDAGQLKLTQPGPEEKHKSAIKTQELQKGEGVKFQEHSYFWTSRLCQIKEYLSRLDNGQVTDITARQGGAILAAIFE